MSGSDHAEIVAIRLGTTSAVAVSVDRQADEINPADPRPSKGILKAMPLLVTLGGSSAASQAMAAVAHVGTKIEFVDPMTSGAAGGGDSDLSPLAMFQSADWVVQAVIIILVLASVITWTIGLAKWVELRRERQRLVDARGSLSKATSLSGLGDGGFIPLSDMIVNAEDEIAVSASDVPELAAEGIKDRVALRIDRVEAAVRRRANRGVGILAIVGSTAPFVGLFGTVWGIMNSFMGIAHSHTTNLAVVAPGIAEALLTTAAGLVAAIPAGILYNVFARELSVYSGELGDVGATILCLAAREIDRSNRRG